MNKMSTMKEVNSKHDMISVKDIIAVCITEVGYSSKEYKVNFVLHTNFIISSDLFETEDEAIKFRNKILEEK